MTRLAVESTKAIVVALFISSFLPVIVGEQIHPCTEDLDCLPNEICEQRFCCRTCAFYNRHVRVDKGAYTASQCVIDNAVRQCAACMPRCFLSFESNGSIAEDCYCPSAMERLASRSEANNMKDSSGANLPYSTFSTSTTQTPGTVSNKTGYIIGGVALGILAILVVGFLVYTFAIKKRE